MWSEFKEWYDDLSHRGKLGFYLVLPLIMCLVMGILFLCGAIVYICWMGGFWTMFFLVACLMCAAGLYFLVED